VVTLAPGANPYELATAYGATVLDYESGSNMAIMLPGPGDSGATLLAKLASDPRVGSSETNSYVQPAESRQKSFAFDDGHNTPEAMAAQPALTNLHALEGMAVSRGDGVRVAILDTGIDEEHPLFAGRIAAGYDFIEDHPGAAEVAYGVDTNEDGYVDAAWGHGTHVAGIVSTVAPGAKLLVGRVLDSDGQGDVLTVAAGIRWATANGAKVINLSLGSLQNSAAIHDAIEDAEHHGIVVVASAGNWGAALPVEYPANDEDVIAVAATDAYATPAAWTSFGPHVAISAPGVAIRSSFPGGIYRQWSGTSMSTPFVSATAALLLSKHRSWDGRDVMRRMASSVNPFANLDAVHEGMMGAGMLDIGESLAPDAPSGDQGAIALPGGRR
jgi:thermitase